MWMHGMKMGSCIHAHDVGHSDGIPLLVADGTSTRSRR